MWAHDSRIVKVCFALLVSGALAAPVFAQTPSIVLDPVLTGLAAPVFDTHGGDGGGRLFVGERGGSIVVPRRGPQPPPLSLDIGDRVFSGGERGLLGLAFHPDYAANGRFFVDSPRRADGATVIAEYHVS